jgi:predicted O-methyltransferase YrrM
MSPLLRRLKSAVRPTPSENLSVGDLFFVGRPQLAVERYEKDPSRYTSQEDLHWIVASYGAVRGDGAMVAGRIDGPLDERSLRALLTDQIAMERAANCLVQPTSVDKALLAAVIGLNAGKRNFVETGTFIGRSAYRVSGAFDSVWTVEASPEIHRAASYLFNQKQTSNIDARVGDSRAFLKAIPADILCDSVVFLDAHFSQGVTSRQFGDCPVLDEIRIIGLRAPGALIVVDDIREMNGRAGYPHLEEILGSLPSGYEAQVVLDQLIATPVTYALSLLASAPTRQ